MKKIVKKSKFKEGKWNKHVEMIDEKEYWKFDSGKICEIPKIENRKKLVIDIDLTVLHKGLESTYYAMKDIYYWPGIKETIKRVIKECETCQINNKKN